MSVLTEFRERVRAIFLADREDRELREELRHHLEMQFEENLRQGMSPEEARRRASRCAARRGLGRFRDTPRCLGCARHI